MERMKDRKYELSIIIPHYNDSKRLSLLINSIPQEQNIEVIIVDDNSKSEEFDKINSIVANYENIFVYCNSSAENSAGKCRNIGIEKAHGSWILFADADDYFMPNMYECIKPYYDSDYDIIFFKADSVKVATNLTSDRHIYNNIILEKYYANPNRLNELNVRMLVPPWAKLIRKDFIVKNGFEFEEIRYSNDVMFSTQIGCNAKKIGVDRNVIYCITDGDGSLTKIKNKESFDIRKRALIRRYIYWYRNLTKDEIKNLGMNDYGLRFVLSPIKNGYGIQLALAYYKMLRNNNIPLFF